MSNDKLAEVISDLQRVESQFRRNGFSKEMGTNSALFLALANTLINAVDDLENIHSERQITIESKVKNLIKEELASDKKVKVIPKKTLKKVKVKE